MSSSQHSTIPLERKLELLESRFTAPSSPATLMPDPDESSSRSQHSFGFDATSRASQSKPTPSWVKMTEKYMNKVAAEDPTILTGHHTEEETSSGKKRVVVQESPPAKENSSPVSKSMTSTASSKRKSIAPVKRLQHGKSTAATSSSTAQQQQPPRKRNRHFSQQTFRHAGENSRDETTSVKNTKRSKSPNNSKIIDFFSSKKQPHYPAKQQQKQRPSQTNTSSPTKQHHQDRITQLETELHDTQSQLKAVSNNRTILHSQLQAALQQTREELARTTEHAAVSAKRYQTALQQHVRTAAFSTARVQREALASNRVGRFVKGWRNQLVWEDGSELVGLQEKLVELNQRQERLEQQQQQCTTSTTSTLYSVGNREAVAFQLRRCQQEQQDTLQKLSQLKKDKVAHQKAASLVVSEDNSSFRDHPTLDGRYVLCSMLGKGGFSEVWKAFDVVELEYVAVKIHALDPRWSDAKKESYTKHVSREYEIQRQVQHVGIVSLKAVFEIDNNSFATVLSLCDGTDLDALLKSKGRLSEEDARAIILQTLSAMLYLATPDETTGRQAIIHYDLKPGNILLDQQGAVKITDFGLSKIMAENDDEAATSIELTSQGAGTYWYLPPECFSSNARISNKVDVWSIGVIYYQMLFGKRPFGHGQSQERILANGTMLNARSVVFPDSVKVGDDCKEFIRACLTFEQTFRPSIPELCSHPYVLRSPATKE